MSGCGCQDKRRMKEALAKRRAEAIEKRNKEIKSEKIVTK